MKNIHTSLITLLFLGLIFPNFNFAQDNQDFELLYEVSRNYPPLSISKNELKEAQTIADLNRYYKPSWVKEYISVEVITNHNGSTKKTVTKNELLSQEQKENMKTADAGTDISVRVQYIPDNTLVDNDVKEINFSFIVEPEKGANYSGGQQKLNEYLKENAIDKIPESSFNIHHLTAVKFTIDEEGFVINAHVFESSNDENVDKILLNTVCNMPNWTPAQYTDGTKVKQDFVLTAGDHRSCVINLLNVDRSVSRKGE